ncbi:AraC family transcriptional regulator [Tenacibaculum crassostreae]|uniref:AraC family transcriptional regulator n=1 Tax=Tenacibaculum crassostreae TaxID=502683 RepID=UPI00389390F7
MKEAKNIESNILKFHVNHDISGVELMNANFKSNRASLHYHLEFIIGVMESGVQSYCPKSPKEKIISKGHISMINPERIHSNKNIDDKGYKYRTFNVQPEVFQQIANDIAQDEVSLPNFDKVTVKDKHLETQLLHLHNSLFLNQFDTIQNQSCFYETFAYLIKTYSSNKLKTGKINANSIIANRIKDYLHTYFDSKITLEELSEVSGLSTYYLNRVFSKSIGIPPHKYLMNLRLNKAQELLKLKNSVTEVGYMVGFFDQSHFTRNFKLFLGITPKQYQSSIS